MVSNKFDTITTRFKQTSDMVQELSTAKFGDAQRVKLIVVTKGQPQEACFEVISAGALNLGENYPEETFKKLSPAMIETTHLHMIGHLQSRKIKYLYPMFSFIHSIDSLELARKVSNHFVQNGNKINALIEVDFSGDSTKNGYLLKSRTEWEQFENDFEEMQQLEGLNLTGLMTMGHNPETPEINREIFRDCRMLFDRLQETYQLSYFTELSMGTSGDFEAAISEGSTMVRVGQRIMGNRLYN